MANVDEGIDFKPETQFKNYNLILTSTTSIFLILICAGWFAIPILEFLPGMALIYLVAIVVLPLLFIVYWNPLYYRSIVYRLDSSEMSWKRGVWFRHTGIVPYNRITNVDVVQGPLMRFFRISDLMIQTAGYSGQANSEISIKGIDNPEVLRDIILDYVRNKKPEASVTGGMDHDDYDEETESEHLLKEVREIRKLLENISKRQ